MVQFTLSTISPPGKVSFSPTWPTSDARVPPPPEADVPGFCPPEEQLTWSAVAAMQQPSMNAELRRMNLLPLAVDRIVTPIRRCA
jgi:hypothetical protein